MPRPAVINDQIQIPASELEVSFARSSGPGGQNVNKVNTKAVLRWNVAETEALPDAARSRFLKNFSRQVNQNGELVLSSDQHRHQSQNLADCYSRLRNLVIASLKSPRKRVTTKPTRASVERRLQEKKRRSEKKQRRRRPRLEE